MIYLDHHAATPLSAPVRAAMAAALERGWANSASVHAAGRAARGLVEGARRALADAVGAEPRDLVFTSGGTEACNLAVLGLAPAGRLHVVTSELEHPAILQAIAALGPRVEVTKLTCEAGRPPSPEALEEALGTSTALVALQWVNHETGQISPVAAYASVCRRRGVALVVDGCQALGKLPCDVAALGATAVIFSAAKIGGPSGAAALWLRRGCTLAATSFGGAQERGRRAGTPDVAALTGFGAAAEELPARLAAVASMVGLRDRLEAACVSLGALVNGRESERVGSACNLSVPGWRGAELVAALDVEGLCASSGAACSSGLDAPSPVLRALYPEAPWRAESALRLTLGPETTAAEVERASELLKRVLGRLP